jgi:hypothetical protein
MLAVIRTALAVLVLVTTFTGRAQPQHVMIDAGLRIPANERSARHTSFMMYFLWDWFDGGRHEGCR